MAKRRWIIGVVVVAGITCSSLASSEVSLRVNAPRAQANRIPLIARFAGIDIGCDSQGALEKTLGPGLSVTGAHPQGAKLWRTRDGAYVIADGFDVNTRKTKRGHGYVVQSLGMTRDNVYASESSKAPIARIHPSKLALAGLHLGDTKELAFKVLASKGLRVNRQGDLYLCSLPGYIRLNDSTVCKEWSLSLSFAAGKLAGLVMVAGGSYSKASPRGKSRSIAGGPLLPSRPQLPAAKSATASG
jgi:hypothetical protein